MPEQTNILTKVRQGFTANKIVAYSTLLILFGIIAGLVAIVWDLACPVVPYGWELVRKLVDHLAIALFSVGVIAFVLEFRDWQEYFKERIAETIVERSYLKMLNKDQLVTLQTESLHAFFGVEHLDGKGSFLEFFNSRIREYIASPYRDDVSYQLLVSDNGASGSQDHWTIDETISFKCRSVGGTNLGYAQWTTEKDVGGALMEFAIIVTSQSPDFSSFPGVADSCVSFARKDLKEIDKDGYFGYQLNLEKFCQFQDLAIKINAQYRYPKGRVTAWTMSHPTRRLSTTLVVPVSVKVLASPFGFDESATDIDEKLGFWSLRHDSWLLPNSGLAIELIPGQIGQDN